ncbi:hypothetical protein D3C71_1749970 [compost metagenome]
MFAKHGLELGLQGFRMIERPELLNDLKLGEKCDANEIFDSGSLGDALPSSPLSDGLLVIAGLLRSIFIARVVLLYNEIEELTSGCHNLSPKHNAYWAA